MTRQQARHSIELLRGIYTPDQQHVTTPASVHVGLALRLEICVLAQSKIYSVGMEQNLHRAHHLNSQDMTLRMRFF